MVTLCHEDLRYLLTLSMAEMIPLVWMERIHADDTSMDTLRFKEIWLNIEAIVREQHR